MTVAGAAAPSKMPVQCYHCGLPVARGYDYRVVGDGEARALRAAMLRVIRENLAWAIVYILAAARSNAGNRAGARDRAP